LGIHLTSAHGHCGDVSTAKRTNKYIINTMSIIGENKSARV